MVEDHFLKDFRSIRGVRWFDLLLWCDFLPNDAIFVQFCQNVPDLLLLAFPVLDLWAGDFACLGAHSSFCGVWVVSFPDGYFANATRLAGRKS